MTKKIEEETTTADIPDGAAGKMAGGRPYFNCDHNEGMFWGLHTKVRCKVQWYKNHYKERIYDRQN